MTIPMKMKKQEFRIVSVSYTHLDVYKRQVFNCTYDDQVDHRNNIIRVKYNYIYKLKFKK